MFFKPKEHEPAHIHAIHPRIKHITPLEDYILRVEFDTGEVVLYEVKEDIGAIPSFSPLSSVDGLFYRATLDSSRTCVVWTDSIDLPSDTILEYGRRLQM